MEFIEDKDNNMQYIISGGGHGCRHDDEMINNELNLKMNNDPLKFMHCNQGGFVRLSVDVEKESMQAFYYLGDSTDVRFFSGIWYLDARYETIDQVMDSIDSDNVDDI